MMLFNRRFVLFALMTVSPAFAQPPPPVGPLPAPEPKITEAQQRLKDSVDSGLMGALNKHCAGLPVVAVDPQYGNLTSSEPEAELPPKLLERLQAIGERRSSVDDPFIPFRVRQSWALAPQIRDEVVADFNGLTWLDLSRGPEFLRLLLASLTPAQIKRLGDANGLALTELNPRAREMASALLKPPFKIKRDTIEEGTDDEGNPVKFNAPVDTEEVTEPVDLRSVRIKAALKVDQISYQTSEHSYSSTAVLSTNDGAYLAFERNTGDNPEIAKVPNTFKPADLDGRRLTAPIGVSGPMSVEDLLKRASTVTGLKLKATGKAGDTPVFVGSKTMPVGDVLDGMRLGLRASFRRLGDTYLLCWDRRGIAVLQQAIEEGLKSVRKESNRIRSEAEYSMSWAEIGLTLPFDANDPLSLTDAQRQRLFASEPASGPNRLTEDRGIPFSEMTNPQQAYVLKSVMNEKIYYPEEQGGPRQGSQEDAQRSYIGSSLAVNVSLFIPGRGWLDCERNWNSPQIRMWQIRNAQRRQSTKTGGAGDIPPEIVEMMKNPEPLTLGAATRGFIVPALSASRLTSLAREMANRDLNTLFYPVLFDGHATIPSKVFPLHSSCKDADGFASAVAIMKKSGVKVVPYLNTLTWQNLESKTHWMSRHKEWWDVDIRGRTAVECLEAQSMIASGLPYSGITPGNWVRPSEPMVSAKLLAFIDEITARKDMAGLAFLDWTHEGSNTFAFSSGVSMKLGFSLPDRIEAFRRTGQDPVDDGSITSREVRPFFPDRMDPETNASPPVWDLMKSLLDRVKAKQKNWTTYLVESSVMEFLRPKGAKAKPPKADVSLTVPFAMTGAPGPKTMMILPVSNENLYTLITRFAEDEGVDEIFADSTIGLLADKPSISLYSIMFAEMGRTLEAAQPGGILLDFRSAPEQITASLPFIAKIKPAAKPEPPKPKVKSK